MEPWIVQMCREKSRRRVIAWASVLGVGVLALIFNARYIVNFIGGPYSLPADELVRITDPGSTLRYFVTVHGEKVINTGVKEVSTSVFKGGQDTTYISSYYALMVKDRILIIKTDALPGTTITGELGALPDYLRIRVFLEGHAGLAENRCLPLYLNAEDFRTRGYFGMATGLIWIALLLGFGLPAWLRFRDVSRHPVIRRCQKWGDIGAISSAVEREFPGAIRYNCHGHTLTDNFIVVNTFFTFNLLRFQDLLWAYRRITTRYVYFLPAGKTHAAILICYGGAGTFMASEPLVLEILRFASTRAPWAIVGYSKQLADLFRKQQNTFCQTVEARRQQVLKRAA
jgi:hypothetical protein